MRNVSRCIILSFYATLFIRRSRESRSFDDGNGVARFFQFLRVLLLLRDIILRLLSVPLVFLCHAGAR